MGSGQSPYSCKVDSGTACSLQKLLHTSFLHPFCPSFLLSRRTRQARPLCSCFVIAAVAVSVIVRYHNIRSHSSMRSTLANFVLELSTKERVTFLLSHTFLFPAAVVLRPPHCWDSAAAHCCVVFDRCDALSALLERNAGTAAGNEAAIVCTHGRVSLVVGDSTTFAKRNVQSWLMGVLVVGPLVGSILHARAGVSRAERKSVYMEITCRKFGGKRNNRVWAP